MSNSIYELIKIYGKGKGEDVMWSSIKMISNELSKTLTPTKYQELAMQIYYLMNGGHYNEEFAEDKVKELYFKDDDGIIHRGGHWDGGSSYKIYQQKRHLIPDEYNEWDWYVTLNMIYSDWYVWLDNNTTFDTNEIDNKIISMAINWLNDDDNPYGTEKIWGYMNGIKH